MSRKAATIGVAVVAAAAAVVGVAAASAVPPRQVHAAMGRLLPRALVRSFRAFRGLRPYEARAIPNHIGLGILLVPEIKQTCIKIIYPRGGSGGDCVPNSMVLAGKMSPILVGTRVTVIGLAPNGNRTVRLVRANGSSETVHVFHNVYTARSRQGFRTVTLKDSIGALRAWGVPDGG